MFDIGFAEMVVIGVVALIVVGPKDLPVMFRRVGQFVGKMRGMARDFQRAMEDAARESGVDEVSRTVRSATSMRNLGLDDVAKSTARASDLYEEKKAAEAETAQDRASAAAAANKAAESWPPEGIAPPADAGSPPDAGPARPAEAPAPEAKPSESKA